MKNIIVHVKHGLMNEFVGHTGSHKEIANNFGYSNIELVWSNDKGHYRVKDFETRQGWYFSEHEIERWFDISSIKPEGTVVLEKAVVINDMRVTKENMEEFFEKIRKMLK